MCGRGPSSFWTWSIQANNSPRGRVKLSTILFWGIGPRESSNTINGSPVCLEWMNSTTEFPCFKTQSPVHAGCKKHIQSPPSPLLSLWGAIVHKFACKSEMLLALLCEFSHWPQCVLWLFTFIRLLWGALCPVWTGPKPFVLSPAC